MKKQLLSAGIFMLTLICGGLLVWGAGQYLKSDGTPDFQKLKSTANGNKLTAEMRDDLMDGLSKMQTSQSTTTVQPTTTVVNIPAGAVVAFNLSSCPQGWTRFAEADGRFIMGSSSKGEKGGTSSITLSINQLPPHSFYTVIEREMVSNMSWNYGWAKDDKKDWGVNSQSRGEKHDDGNERYSLQMTNGKTRNIEANAGKTNTLGNGQSINIQNPYIKLLYCQKN